MLRRKKDIKSSEKTLKSDSGCAVLQTQGKESSNRKTQSNEDAY